MQFDASALDLHAADQGADRKQPTIIALSSCVQHKDPEKVRDIVNVSSRIGGRSVD